MSQDQKDILERLYLAQAFELDRLLGSYPRLKYALVHHRNIRGDMMRFDDKPYLLGIYMDDAREIVLQSSVQTGKSEFLIVSAHSYAEQAMQVLYVLPDLDIRNQFVANRIDKLYSQIPHYRSMVDKSTGVADSRGLKHFGKGTIFFAGSKSSTTFIEKPIDVVIGDETDKFDQDNYEKADDRMTASPYKIKREASNPTVDKYGINARYILTDQREWWIRCSSCNKWQRMDWFRNVVQQTDDNDYRLRDQEWTPGCGRDIFMKCIKCGAPLDRFRPGAWVAKHQDRRDAHGYLIHQMLSSYVKISEMWQKFSLALENDSKMQVFYNSMLGQTFAGKGSKLTDELLNACKQDFLMPADVREPCCMGVDVGKKLHVRVNQILPGEQFRCVFAGTVRDFEDLDYLQARFNIVTFCIDAMPETRKANEYVAKYPHKGWIVRYQKRLQEMQKNEDTRVISADRTIMMDNVMALYQRRKMILPKNAQSIDRGEFYELLKTPTRVLDPDTQEYEWRGDPDHYFHAEVYALLAYMVRGSYSVVGLNPHAPAVQKPPSSIEAIEAMFPPNAPPELVEHYRRLWRQAMGHDTMGPDAE